MTKLEISRRAVVAGGLSVALGLGVPASGEMKPLPVVLDTDIGDDIDDTWALGLLLRSPELDLRYVLTDFGKPAYRAKLTAKFLQTVGHGNIPIGMGVGAMAPETNPQEGWIRDYDIKSYPGKVHQDGVARLIEMIMQSRETLTIIAIGPVTNLAVALAKEPRIARKARIFGMHGSVRIGYGGKKSPDPEYNVERDIKAAKAVFSADWPICITSLDTCGLIDLHTERYLQLLRSTDVMARTILDNYAIWEAAVNKRTEVKLNSSQTSTLFDTVAVYLAATAAGGRNLVNMENLNIEVDDRGVTREVATGKKMEVATSWKNLDGFRDHLLSRLAK